MSNVELNQTCGPLLRHRTVRSETAGGRRDHHQPVNHLRQNLRSPRISGILRNRYCSNERIAVIMPRGNREIPVLFQNRKFAAVCIGTADALPQITAGKRFLLVQHVMVARKVTIAFDCTRRIGRNRLQQVIILRNRKMLEYHARQRLLRGRRLPRRRNRLRLLDQRMRHIGEKTQCSHGRASIAARTRIIARIDQHQSQYVTCAINIHHGQGECARFASVHALFRQHSRLFAGTRLSRGRIEAAGEFLADPFNLGIIQTTLKIMIPESHHPGNATIGERSHQLFDCGTDHRTRLPESLLIPFGRGLHGGLRLIPAALAHGLGVHGIIAGDLVAGEDNDIRARGVK